MSGRGVEVLGLGCNASPHGGVRPFHQTSTYLTQLTLGPYVVQIRSRNSPESGVDETLVNKWLASLSCVRAPVLAAHCEVQVLDGPASGKRAPRVNGLQG